MRALLISCLLLTGLLTQVQQVGLSSAFLQPEMPGPKLLSVPLLKGSTRWKVRVGFNGLPAALSTAVPIPAGGDVGRSIQSPIPDGVLAKRSPSMPNPPVGGLTGAVPPGSGGQFSCAAWLGRPKPKARSQSARSAHE